MVHTKPTTTTVKVLRGDLKRLADYKVHPKQPYWEVIKAILDKVAIEKEVKTK